MTERFRKADECPGDIQVKEPRSGWDDSHSLSFPPSPQAFRRRHKLSAVATGFPPSPRLSAVAKAFRRRQGFGGHGGGHGGGDGGGDSPPSPQAIADKVASIINRDTRKFYSRIADKPNRLW